MLFIKLRWLQSLKVIVRRRNYIWRLSELTWFLVLYNPSLVSLSFNIIMLFHVCQLLRFILYFSFDIDLLSGCIFISISLLKYWVIDLGLPHLHLSSRWRWCRTNFNSCTFRRLFIYWYLMLTVTFLIKAFFTLKLGGLLRRFKKLRLITFWHNSIVHNALLTLSFKSFYGWYIFRIIETFTAFSSAISTVLSARYFILIF